jgi:glycine betaine/proline transport system substrate-binding protein
MSRNLRLGHIDLSFHAASAAVVQTILERDGHTVELSAAPHEQMFERYGRAEVDLLVSAWLPASHGTYLAPHLQATRKLGVLYRPYCVWGVPEYVPESAVSQVSDLLKPEILVRMERRIQGINPGAGISRFSEAMVQAYGLADAGYHFRPGTEAECFDGYEQAVREGNLHGRPCMPSDIFGSGSRVESAALHSACVCETSSRALMEYAGRCLICV